MKTYRMNESSELTPLERDILHTIGRLNGDGIKMAMKRLYQMTCEEGVA